MLIFRKAKAGELQMDGLAKIAAVCDVTKEGVVLHHRGDVTGWLDITSREHTIALASFLTFHQLSFSWHCSPHMTAESTHA